MFRAYKYHPSTNNLKVVTEADGTVGTVFPGR